MMCGHANELIAASWLGELDRESASKLRSHLAACPVCAAASDELGAIWERLADLPVPEPSRALDLRWQATLESFLESRRPRWPVWQWGFAALCLVIGVLIGMNLQPPAGKKEIARLREEVETTRQMVALSLLQQQSPSDRLRGVDYSERMSALEPEVVAALIQAVNRDPSVNVRLAAVDALTKVSAEPQVRRSLVDSLPGQHSPIVQAALIDFAVDAHDRQAVPALRELADRPGLNPVVRQRADRAMRQLAR